MAGLGGPEIIMILVVVLLMFGGKKIPELMRGLGKGMKEFKDGKDGVTEELEPKPVTVPISKEIKN
ncbi:MAG: twin-arginine translocase TatA/TatE family subunit [Daejeonella sp.]|uniref:Sec-independent protein translocase subunit TatA/TatB n=1 Tax=Daejeonella sp. TaxID=2805397 RepID=UPI003C73A2A4